MVADRDAEQTAGLHELSRDSEVLRRRLGVAARVVVDDDDAGGCTCDRRREDLAGVNERGVQQTHRQPSLQADAVLGVQVDRPELFLPAIPELRSQPTEHVARTSHATCRPSVLCGETAPQLHCRHDPRRPRLSDPSHRSDLGRIRPSQTAERAIVGVQQLGCHINRGATPGADPDEDGEELPRSQGGRLLGCEALVAGQ